MILQTESLTIGPQARLALASLLVVVMLYWLVRRLRGNGEDASVRSQMTSETGTISFLASGTMAFAILAALAGLFLSPEILRRPILGVALLVPVVIAWILNKREVSS
jgi:hypothetical protein